MSDPIRQSEWSLFYSVMALRSFYLNRKCKEVMFNVEFRSMMFHILQAIFLSGSQARPAGAMVLPVAVSAADAAPALPSGDGTRVEPHQPRQEEARLQQEEE